MPGRAPVDPVDELEALLDDLTRIHPGITLILAGARCLTRDQLTPDQTQTLCAALAGSPGADVLTLLGLLVQYLTSPDTNPALRALPENQQKEARRFGEQAAYQLSDPYLHQPASEASAAISGTF